MPREESLDWLVQIHDEHGATLHRLAVLLGAESQSGRIVRSALLALGRRGHRLIDPVERIEFLHEHVVHLARAVRPATAQLSLPTVEEPRQEEILSAISSMPVRLSELLVVSHYLTVFGPELAGIIRMSVRGSNQRLEAALESLRATVGDPTPGSQPGVIESLSQEVTAALRSAARQVQAPGTETLGDELRDVAQHRSFTLGPKLVAASVLAAAALGLLLASATRPTLASIEPIAPASSAAATAAPSESIPALVRAVPIHYVGRADGKLYRENRDLAASSQLVRTALEAILSLVPLDPDYATAWKPGQLLSAEVVDDTLVVDLVASAYEDITDPTTAQQAIDQVVYTTSELLGVPDLRVFFRADGGLPPEPFRSNTGFTRRGLNPTLWITSPRNTSQQSAGNIVVQGQVKPEGSVPVVTVTNLETNQVVAQASAQTSTEPDQEGWRQWSVTLSLPAGNYDVRAVVTTGASPTQSSENKVIRVS